jgi:hypothetical protein
MSTIAISDIPSYGASLFSDSESYLTELTDEELNLAHGGTGLIPIVLTIVVDLTVRQALTLPPPPPKPMKPPDKIG